MRSILLKGRNTASDSDINSSNRFNKCKPLRHLSHKGKPFVRSNLYEFLSDLMVEEDAYEDSDTGIEDAIEVNESASTLLFNLTSANKINPEDIRKLISTSNKWKPSPKISKRLLLNLN